MKRILLLGATLIAIKFNGSAQNHTFQEPGLTYGLPAVFQNTKGEAVLAWTERAENGNVSYVFTKSTDQGKTFGDKRVIYSSPSIGTGRLARPRLLFKKNGEMIAVFTINPDAKLLQAGETVSGRPKDMQIHFTSSTDGGSTWTAPKALHQDLDPNIIRGFFDATLMANDELAVVFLKDIPGKKHERDLRIITTENGVPQAERVVDPFVCDCCNLGLLTDANGNLNLYYRENQDNLRDIAKVVSTDNGKTFSKQSWVYRDNWKINACPHNGPQAIAHGNTNLIAYYSGKDADQGIRLVNQNGDLLTKVTDESVKMATLVGKDNNAVLLYAQGDKDKGTKIGYRSVKSGKAAKEKWVVASENGTNPNGLMIDKNLLLTYEVSEGGKAKAIRTSLIKL